ncbi:MAG: DUF4337 family protein [Candidatus Eremiobacteraeota bacterium]|nr:DUF4337 family protein [Candidatus Eremiobacteraeota bacterium]
MADFHPHKAIEEARERSEHAQNNRLVAILAATFAVLAAIATLLAHGRSVTALIDKDEAILAQSKAVDAYNYYESKRIKYHLYQAFVTVGIGNPGAHQRLAAIATKEQNDAKPILSNARQFETAAAGAEEHSERALRAFERLEAAVTLLEVSIVFVSISALIRNQALLMVSGVIAATGFVFLIFGVLYHL